MSEESVFRVQKTIEENWIKLPSNIGIATFLNGDKFLEPESVKVLEKVIMEWKLNNG